MMIRVGLPRIEPDPGLLVTCFSIHLSRTPRLDLTMRPRQHRNENALLLLLVSCIYLVKICSNNNNVLIFTHHAVCRATKISARHWPWHAINITASW